MQFNTHQFNFANPESWLIILIYAGFWIYSYYSLIILLIYMRRQHSCSEAEEQSFEIESESFMLQKP